ncbi:hypothetical protein [Alteromonas oceanisediminis]|uniref:hypothetical protein n=1 Tax=Alteromonas oceanisediminis TaxID=2836180 RepID=UPI001BD92852|nr:hypothetical protein [Alteromonas oceanisediminis]MBT0587741.1 hypothetical protein [Alteromonas oceanisediminis]
MDTQGGETHYAYDGTGNVIAIEDANNNTITAGYDALGRKRHVSDPNQGTTQFTYNDFGELEKETDANNQSIYYDMDHLGRVTHRYGSNGAPATFVFNTRGLLASETVSGHSRTYTYDTAARVTGTTVTMGSASYVTSHTYDAATGTLTSMTYPTASGHSQGLTVEYRYNPRGYLTHEQNAASKYVYREVTA